MFPYSEKGGVGGLFSLQGCSQNKNRERQMAAPAIANKRRRELARNTTSFIRTFDLYGSLFVFGVLVVLLRKVSGVNSSGKVNFFGPGGTCGSLNNCTFFISWFLGGCVVRIFWGRLLLVLLRKWQSVCAFIVECLRPSWPLGDIMVGHLIFVVTFWGVTWVPFFLGGGLVREDWTRSPFIAYCVAWWHFLHRKCQ